MGVITLIFSMIINNALSHFRSLIGTTLAATSSNSFPSIVTTAFRALHVSPALLRDGMLLVSLR